MPSEIPAFPNEPFDGTGLSVEELLALTHQQRVWADITDAQAIALSDRLPEGPERPLHEGHPKYIPKPDKVQEVAEFFRWVDDMHALVRRPEGAAWVEIQLMLASMGKWMDWANRTDIDIHYRYRIDAPMDPHPTVPDHIPDGWKDRP